MLLFSRGLISLMAAPCSDLFLIKREKEQSATAWRDPGLCTEGPGRGVDSRCHEPPRAAAED